MQFLGAGQQPTDVQFGSNCMGPNSMPQNLNMDPGTLNDFWRGAENFHSMNTNARPDDSVSNNMGKTTIGDVNDAVLGQGGVW